MDMVLDLVCFDVGHRLAVELCRHSCPSRQWLGLMNILFKAAVGLVVVLLAMVVLKEMLGPVLVAVHSSSGSLLRWKR